MQSPLIAKESLSADTPLLLFDCTLADGSMQHWSSQAFQWNGVAYDARLVRHNLFEAQLASDTQVGGAPKLTFELANADSRLSQIEQQTGFKGSKIAVRVILADLAAGTAMTDPFVVFTGLMNSPELVTEDTFRLSAMNRMSAQRSVVPDVRVQRLCPWRFPGTAGQRAEAVDGGSDKGKYSPFYRCGYSADQPGGRGNLDGTNPFTNCARTRGDCEARGMFQTDSSGRSTGHFGGIEFVPPTILVRGSGQKNYSLSAVQDNQARYNDFVPLVYGTQWHSPDVVFSRNDGNLTRMEVLLGLGEIQGLLKVLVNGVEIPRGVSGVNMTSTGWYNLITPGTRDGGADPNFTDGHGHLMGDPYGSMAYLSVVVPNRVNDGTSVPSVQVLMQGLKLPQFDSAGSYLGEQFSDNPAWVLLDVIRRCGYSLEEVDAASFARAAAYAGTLITTQDPLGGEVELPRFQCNFALKQRRSAGEIVRALRNSCRMYLVLNSAGKLEVRVEDTFAVQQSSKPAGSNAVATYAGGWPAYEFDAASIARNADGSSSVRMSSRGAQDVANRLSVEFQDAFNQYQHDSLSLSDGDDVDLRGQEVAAAWDAVGITTFNQAARMLLLGLNRGVEGNVFVEFSTSVKALGLMPGDLITVTYAKENLNRTPFRITRIVPGVSFRTATISAQLHNDAWYSDTVTGIVGGRGWHSGQGSGLPAPVCGSFADSSGTLQLGVREAEVGGSDGSANVELAVAFTVPGGSTGSLASPLVGLTPVVSTTGGSLPGSANYFYSISAVDSAGGEGPLSFVAQAGVSAASSTNSVRVEGIGLPAGAAGFHVYRGLTPRQLFRIASNVSPATAFTDNGFTPLTVLPPDPRFDHVDIYWRWELLPETPAAVHSSTILGSSVLQLGTNQYVGARVRITNGAGAGQERTIAANDLHTVTVNPPWSVVPDASSSFAIAETGWRFGSRGPTSPITVTVPERMGSGLHICARAANVGGDEAEFDLSPVTRWVLGQSGALPADSDVPSGPVFGVAVSSARGGVLDLGAISFPSLLNTRSITSGTYKFHYYDEIEGAPPTVLSTGLPLSATTMAFSVAVDPGKAVQIDGEVIVAGTTSGGITTIQRGMYGTTAATHTSGSLIYQLDEKVAIVPFAKGFFGSPAAGDWKYSLELPNVRLATVELFLTNALGNGAISTLPLTTFVDNGLRSLGGWQYSFQISGYLALQAGAAPSIVVDADRAVRDLFGLLGTAATGSGVTIQINRNSTPYATVQFDPGSTTSITTPGFGLHALRAGDILSMDVTGVGTTNPGSDLSLVIRC